jgi:hypothetical protein
MIINAAEARNNVYKYKKDFGTSSLKKILEAIKDLSEDGKSTLILGRYDYNFHMNKKDYYLLKQGGFNIEFSGAYERIRINEYRTDIKTRPLTLMEFFNSNEITDKEVKISW